MAINDFKVRHGIVVGPDDFSVDVSTDTARFADGYVVNIGTARILKQTDNISELTNDSGYLVSKADVDALNVDADTLDGINGAQFLRSDVDGTVTGNLTVSGGTGPAIFTVVADSDNSNIDDTATIQLSQRGNSVTGAWGFDSSNIMYFESIVSGIPSILDFRTNNGGTVRANGNLVFHAGNSKPYSTTEQNKLSNIEDNATADQTKFDIDALNIDADTLDGQQGTFYLDFANFTSIPDPVVTLNGDVTGSATMTNLASINITVQVNDNSHNHTIANVTQLQTTLDDNAAQATGDAISFAIALG